MIVFPNAKINLGLHIIDKRADGFHNIETCFYPTGWKEVLEIIPADSLAFTSSGLSIPSNSAENLCLQAYKLIKSDFDIPPIKIHLHKIIPIGAGLGGGSSDAAFTLKLLNDKFKLAIAEEKLVEYASKLGSDCAFFINNRPAFATAKGEKQESVSLPYFLRHYLVVIFPNIHISTAVAYQNVDKRGKSAGLKEKLTMPIVEWKDHIDNDFEKTVFSFHPAIAQIKAQLYKENALYAAMSGSGSAVFGLFKHEPDLDKFRQPNHVIWSGEF